MTNSCTCKAEHWQPHAESCPAYKPKPLLTLENIRSGAVPSDAVAAGFLLGEIERLRETLNCPTLTADAPAAQFKAVLDLAEKGEPVNHMDLINALWWRVRNQKREIARLHATIGGES